MNRMMWKLQLMAAGCLVAGPWACKPLTALETAEAPSSQTCGGDAPDAGAQHHLVLAKHTPTKCLLDTVFTPFANSTSEAEQCVEDALAQAGLSNMELVVNQPPSNRCIVTIDGSWCTPSIHPSLSSEDAVACVKAGCGSCTVQDVTSSVQTYGHLNASACANWCENNGYP